MSNATIPCHLSSQWIATNTLFQGTLPLCIWFHLEMLMTKTNIYVTFPSLSHSPLGNPITLFHVVTDLPSSLTSPIPVNPSLGKSFLHRKVKQKRHILASTIILVIACSWKSMEITGCQCLTMALLLKYSTSILLFVPISSQSLGQKSMDATVFLHLHCEEFSCLLVSQPLPQSKTKSLGPKPTLQSLKLYHIHTRSLGPKLGCTLQDLPHIPIRDY